MKKAEEEQSHLVKQHGSHDTQQGKANIHQLTIIIYGTDLMQRLTRE